MRIYAIFVLLLFFFASCKNKSEQSEINFFENQSVPLKEKIKKVLENDNLTKLGFDENQSKWIQEYYKKRQYKPRWINKKKLNNKGYNLQYTLDHTPWFGIPHNRKTLFRKKKDRLWVEQEIILTATAAQILNDLNHGFIDHENKKYKASEFIRLSAFDSLLPTKAYKKFDTYFLNQGPSDTNYRFLANQLYNYCSKHKIDTTHFKIKSIKEDTLHAFENMRLALVSKGFLDKNEKDSLTISNKLKQFQEENSLKPDGVIGKHTAQALNESTLDKVYRAGLVLDRWRSNFDYPDKYVRINIPEFLLRFYANDSLKRIHNIIVGKPENQTPQLESKIRNIIVYPYWNVPHSIATKEILPALKGNSSYLSRNNFRIYRGENEVNPYGVNWRGIRNNTFPYKVVQDPGPKNSLGVIKFEFHNQYSVYVHDTPTKGLFRTNVRAYSHGCMRCQDPIDLGKTILDYDSIRRKRNDLTADSLDSLLLLAENYKIILRDPIPIFVEYNSVTADRERIIFHLDIYRRDEEYLKMMYK